MCCSFYGTIPAFLGDFAYLTRLWLHDNDLTVGSNGQALRCVAGIATLTVLYFQCS